MHIKIHFSTNNNRKEKLRKREVLNRKDRKKGPKANEEMAAKENIFWFVCAKFTCTLVFMRVANRRG